MFGNGTSRSPSDPNRYFTLDKADIVVHRMEGALEQSSMEIVSSTDKQLGICSGTFACSKTCILLHCGTVFVVEAIVQLARLLPPTSTLGNTALAVANEITNIFRHDNLHTIALARKHAQKVLGKDWQRKGAEVYQGDNASHDSRAPIWAISNCHIGASFSLLLPNGCV